MPRYSDQQLKDALTACKGMVYVAAKHLGCSPTTIKDRLVTNEGLRDHLQQQQELMTDQAELVLSKAVLAGEAWAVQFYLKTKGRHRGYIERTESLTEVQARVTVEEHQPEHLTPETIDRVARGLLTS